MNLHQIIRFGSVALALLVFPALSYAQTDEGYSSSSDAVVSPAGAGDAINGSAQVHNYRAPRFQTTDGSEAAMYEQAEPENTYAGESDYQVIEAEWLGTGFSFFVNVGGMYNFYERTSSGYTAFSTPSAGGFLSFDVGYKVSPYFGIYGHGLLRYAYALGTATERHCPKSLNFLGPSDGQLCYDYRTIDAGKFDGYYGGLGLMLMGFIPLTDTMYMSLGGGGVLYLGRGLDKPRTIMNFAIKLAIGIHWRVNDVLAAGVTLAEEGLLLEHRSLSPSFTLTYNY